jgi:hypothetical protein
LERAPTLPPHSLLIPEIGRTATVHSREGLEEKIRDHIARNYGSGLGAMQFRDRMKPYMAAIEALEALEAIEIQARESNGTEALEKEQTAAYAGEKKSWAALVNYVKAHPQAAPAVARYLTGPDQSPAESPPWKWAQFLTALAKRAA